MTRLKPLLKLLSMKIIFLFSLFLGASALARTEICPAKSNSMIAPIVDVTVKFNKKKKLYTYEYNLTNGSEAFVPIWKFSIEAGAEPVSVTAAKAWENAGYSKENHEISWNYKSKSLKPGQTLGHFMVESFSPPQAVMAFADGDVSELPTVKFDNDEEEKDPDMVACVGFFKGEGNRDQVSTVTTGPALNRQEVKMRIKRPSEKLWSGNPDGAAELTLSPLEEGALELVIFDSKDVDVSKIKLVSLELGTGHGKINPAKVVIRSGFDETLDSDAYAFLQKNKGKYLRVEFLIPDLALRCNADRALFLTGTFEDGRQLFGAVKINPVPCDEKTFAPEAKRQRYKP